MQAKNRGVIMLLQDSVESLAMLRILAMGRKDLDAGQVKPAGEAFALIREKIRLRQQP